MPETSRKEIEEFRAAILKGLKEKFRENDLDKIIRYADVSRAFPGGPHENSFEIRAIDKKALKQWCSENGLDVAFLTEKEAPENFKRGFPPLRFKRLPNQ